MSTTIRPELSEKNKYWIERHRFYELKHFCLQYPIWEKLRDSIDGYAKKPVEAVIFATETSDPTERAAEARAYYNERMEMVEKAMTETDLVIGPIIFKGVTEGLSYEVLKTRMDIPCCKDVYYELYRKFFWILSQIRK